MKTVSELPARMTLLPLDRHDRPVPWFVWIDDDGVPDFRVVGPGKLHQALRGGLCWVCGRGFSGGEERAFLVGPMCIINRVSAEPPSHVDCAVFSARSCPFLATPSMVRRDRHMPEGAVNPAGIMIRRNPGASVVWVTGYRGWKAEREHGTAPSLRQVVAATRARDSDRALAAAVAARRAVNGPGYLFRLGPPKRALWFAEGRDATRAEVLASIDSGLPILREVADEDGPEAVAELERMHRAALAYVPQEVAAGA